MWMNMDIEKLETLPKKVGRKGYLTTKYGNMWNLRSFDSSWRSSNKTKTPWFIVKIVLKKFLGKSFADAFSYYCSKVEQRYQDEFLDEFRNRLGRSWYQNDYIINSEGNIQLNPERYQYKKRTDLTFRSFDYKEGWYNIKTGEKRIDSEAMSYFGPKTIFKYVRNSKEKVISKDWIKIVIQGYEKTFESKKDPEYRRLMIENIKAQRLNSKRHQKYLSQKAYSFMTDDERQKKKDKELNILTRNRYGFDNESFKTNPYQNASEE